jgi:DNA-binding HxlR family transcriptional regulator
MPRPPICDEFGCPVEVTQSVIGGKWKGVILHFLLSGTKRFGDLRRQFPAITQRMLTLQLRELEAAGVIDRKVYAEVPPKVEYSLTEFGLTLQPILDMMNSWGTQYQGRIEDSIASHQPADDDADTAVTSAR